MPAPFSASKTDEYFISIAKQGRHSFIMLGVVVDGRAKLLGRFGKTRRNDPSCTEPCMYMFSEINAHLRREQITQSDPSHTRDITYSAYAITYQQTLDLIAYLKKINKQQCLDHARNDEEDQCHSMYLNDLPEGDLSDAADFNAGYIRINNQEKNLNKLFYINKQNKIKKELELPRDLLRNYDAIIQNDTNAPSLIIPLERLNKIAPMVRCWYLIATYLPNECGADNIEFKYDIYVPDMNEEQDTGLLEDTRYARMRYFNNENSCGDTAVDLLNYARGETETPYNVSTKFYRGLPVPTTLVAGQISQDRPFYILPLPPTAFRPASSGDAVTKQQELLTKLYRRMEDIITLEPDSPKTVEKFNKLKDLYERQAPQPYDNPEDIIASIIEWRNREENHHVFELRKTYFFDWFITRQSATTKMFDEFEQTPTR
jgi:hypothetical protein